MQFPDYQTFAGWCMLGDKIELINSLLLHNAVVIEQLDKVSNFLMQRVQSLISMNESISKELESKREQEHETCGLID
jgi:hypothetical protein